VTGSHGATTETSHFMSPTPFRVRDQFDALGIMPNDAFEPTIYKFLNNG
jgi:hypothetical protein